MSFRSALWSLVSLVHGAGDETTRPTPSPALPAEIILAILEHGYYTQDLEPDTRFLANCALVCKAWTAPSQSLLFRDVHLRTRAAYISFCSAIDQSSHLSKGFGEIVVRLRLVIDPKHPDALSPDPLVHAMKLCPNLFELDLALYGEGSDTTVPTLASEGADAVPPTGTPSFSSETLDVLRAGPRIRSLKFANWTDNDGLALQLLEALPSLNALALKGVAPLLPTSPEETDSLPPCAAKLTSIRLGFQTQPKMALLDWLLGDSSASLRTLEVEQETPIELLSPLLRQYGPALHSLALPSCTPREHVTAVTTHCTALRELRLGTATHPLSPLLFKQLPPSIEHLALPIARDTPLYPVVKFVGEAKNKQLKALTVHLWDGAETHPQLPSLRIACAMRGVEMRCVRSVWAFRALVRGDPVPSSSFPLPKSPANLARMLRITRAGSSEPSVKDDGRRMPGDSPDDLVPLALKSSVGKTEMREEAFIKST